jgi:rhamnogalacturonyl hydrolase YesR
MSPPFLAYLAVTTSDKSYLRTAIEQIKKYREVLVVKKGKAKGLWRHIIGPQNEDQGCWSTGNGWTAMGIARVWATMTKWSRSAGWRDESVGFRSFRSQFEDEVNALRQIRLKEYIKDIIDGAVDQERDPTNGLLQNYIDDESWFGEISGTAMLAAAVHRMAVHAPEEFGPR